MRTEDSNRTDQPATTTVSPPTPGQAVMPRPTLNTETGLVEIPTPVTGGLLRFEIGQRTLTKEQLAILAPTGIDAKFDPAYVMMFLAECHTRGLDPWTGEAYLMLYPGNKYIRHIGIAGFLRIAEETGQFEGLDQVLYAGLDDLAADCWREVWPHRDKPPYAAKATAYRTGRRPSTVVALYDEYAPLEEDKRRVQGEDGQWRRVPTGLGRVPVPMWQTADKGGKASVMLAKCARAASLRLLFPKRLAGFYEPAEFERAAQDLVGQVGDEVAARRREAYAAACGAQTVEGVDVGAEVIDVADPGQAEGRRMAEDQARALLLGELDAQARLLRRDREWMTRKWSASRGGQRLEDASLATITAHVHRFRAYLIGWLRDHGRHTLAEAYAAAPPVGTLEDLFGVETPWDVPADQPAPAEAQVAA